MITTTWKLQEIHADLWGSHDSHLLLDKTYVILLYDKLIQKSLILLLKSKDKFFYTFKLLFPRTKETNKEKLGCLQTNCRREFISIVLKNFCKKRSITISYASLFMHEEIE